MGLRCGIVGLPNVGKSTLFNALTATAAAETANFPFCTIEPNIGKVAVPDKRLGKIAKIAKSKVIIQNQIEFLDIAGLVKGASKGEGLGNQFLANIREVDAIVHVLRCFSDDNITHVSERIDPVSDAEIVETELILADLESLEKRVPSLEKKIRGGDKVAEKELIIINNVIDALRAGNPARFVEIERDLFKQFSMLQLLTAKPVVYVCNVEESAAACGNQFSSHVLNWVVEQQSQGVIVSAKIEEEVSNLSDADEKKEYLDSIGLSETGLAKVIRAGYGALNLITFFTSGPNESRAWSVPNGAKAPEAAGVIHTDFERGFIKAGTISYDDFMLFNGELGAKEAGKMRQEGKDYRIIDGDIMHFKFNV